MSQHHTLPTDTLLTLPARRGACLWVESGTVWFTADGADVVLAAGQRYWIEVDEPLLLQAMHPSRVRLTEPLRAAPAISGLERLRRYLQNVLSQG